MLGYCTIGSNDVPQAGKFFDGIASVLGHGRMAETDKFIMWGTPGKGAMMAVITPANGEPATVGNGSMFGLHADSEEQIHQVYDYAIAHGGSDEGTPGPR